jgi:hypothetical protein
MVPGETLAQYWAYKRRMDRFEREQRIEVPEVAIRTEFSGIVYHGPTFDLEAMR